MMHMIKLCVGVATLEELESYREERAHWWGADYGENVHVHRTRAMPKRLAPHQSRGGKSPTDWKSPIHFRNMSSVSMQS